MYYLNEHCHKAKKYTEKVEHKFQYPPLGEGCQNLIQNSVQEHLSVIRSGRLRPFSFVENDKLYKLLVLIVDSDIKEFVNFGKRHNLNMQTDEIS